MCAFMETQKEESGFNMARSLYKSTKNRIVTGVCGGFAEFTGMNATIVRAIVLVCCLTGVGIIPYILASVILTTAPTDSQQATNSEPWSDN